MQPSFSFALAAIVLGIVVTTTSPAATAAGNAGVIPVASTATATPLPGEAAVRKAITSLVADAKVEAVRGTPVPGLLEVDTSDEVVYVTSDGKYLMTGSLIDVASKRDLTETSRAATRRALLKDVTPAQMIVFAPKNPKYTVTVFTDVDCGYCRKLHSQIAEYNKAGIAVDYLFFPRDGLGTESYDKAVSVWCSTNRQKAFTDAKKGLPVAKLSCANPVAADFNLGLKMGIDGTPSVFAADGTQIGGYVPPAQMRASLEKLAKQPSS